MVGMPIHVVYMSTKYSSKVGNHDIYHSTILYEVTQQYSTRYVTLTPPPLAQSAGLRD